MAEKVKYAEPTNYIPKSIQKKYGIGEYAKKATTAKKTTKKKK